MHIGSDSVSDAHSVGTSVTRKAQRLGCYLTNHQRISSGCLSTRTGDAVVDEPTFKAKKLNQLLKKAAMLRAEGTYVSFRWGFRPRLNESHAYGRSMGVLNPCSLRSRAENKSLNSLQHSCLLPSAFPDKTIILYTCPKGCRRQGR